MKGREGLGELGELGGGLGWGAPRRGLESLESLEGAWATKGLGELGELGGGLG